MSNLAKSWKRLTAGVAVLFGILVLATGPVALGQASFGAIVGSVKDSSGAEVPGAQVTITNNGTNAIFTTKTGSGGSYSALNLNPGNYTVTVGMSGFKTTSHDRVDVTIGGTAR